MSYKTAALAEMLVQVSYLLPKRFAIEFSSRLIRINKFLRKWME